ADLPVEHPAAQQKVAAEGEHGAEAEHGEHAAVAEHGEHAEHGEEHEAKIENWWDLDYKAKHLPPPFGFAIINFLIFAAIMYKLAAKPLKSFIAERHSGIRKALDEASALHKEAVEKLKGYEARISNIDAEINQLLAQIKQEAEAEKARLIAAAEDQAKRLK